MMRECVHCHQKFLALDLAKEISKEIEHERKAAGVQGVFFRCYACSHCGHENLFVDVHMLEGETPEAFQRRRNELEETIRQSPQAGVDVALVDKRS